MRKRIRTNRATGTRAIFNDDRLTEETWQLVCEESRQQVRRSASAKRHDKLDGFIWVRLRHYRGSQQECACNKDTRHILCVNRNTHEGSLFLNIGTPYCCD